MLQCPYVADVQIRHALEARRKNYYDELPAASMVEATDYFIDNKRDDVTLVRVEEVGPDDDSSVQEPSHSPIKPFSPLIARRRLDKDEDAR